MLGSFSLGNQGQYINAEIIYKNGDVRILYSKAQGHTIIKSGLGC